jgi:hypothetical protein
MNDLLARHQREVELAHAASYSPGRRSTVKSDTRGAQCRIRVAEARSEGDHGELQVCRNWRSVDSLATSAKPRHRSPHAGLARPDGSSDRHDDLWFHGATFLKSE